MKKAAVILLGIIMFGFASCYTLDGISDVSISFNLPDEIVVSNNARVSTLNSIDGKIVRSGVSVYVFHFDVDIPAKHYETIKINDFLIQNGDEGFVVDVKLSWSM